MTTREEPSRWQDGSFASRHYGLCLFIRPSLAFVGPVCPPKAEHPRHHIDPLPPWPPPVICRSNQAVLRR